MMRDLDAAGCGCLFHSCSQVDGVPHGGVFHPQVGTDRADHHQAGVDAHPDVKVDAITLVDQFPVWI